MHRRMTRNHFSLSIHHQHFGSGGTDIYAHEIRFHYCSWKCYLKIKISINICQEGCKSIYFRFTNAVCRLFPLVAEAAVFFAALLFCACRVGLLAAPFGLAVILEANSCASKPWYDPKTSEANLSKN